MQKVNNFLPLLLLIVCQLFFQNRTYGQISLDYGEFGVFFKPEKCVDTVQFTLTKYYPGYILKIFLKDCGGACSIKLYNKKKRLKMTGNYVNGPDTLTKYKYSKQLGPPFDKKYYGIQKIKYVSPLQKGLWTYYDEKGKIVDSFQYEYNFR